VIDSGSKRADGDRTQDGRRAIVPGRSGGRALMVVGTGSHAGKTVIAAALCRIYARRGLAVAPFKAQNMALNSFVTPEGAEIGRAQAYQASAAGVEPHVDMNPILLKPTSHEGCQVVFMGRPVGHMGVREYHDFQPQAWFEVTAALARLRAANDLVVIEGAGSAAEVNLRDNDIVNMRVAVHAEAPTILVGDIDRGGIFAAFVGTVELLLPAERELLRGFVINKFRGDATLLDPGLEFLRERTGIPTLAVVPFLTDWRGDEEDSLGIDDRRRRGRPGAPLRIAVVRLPYVSNFTDFDVLADEPDVDVRYVTSPDELEGASAVVLPGTKSTVADLGWLRERGFAGALGAAAGAGTPVIGVCGGYQMLGRRILDPERVESAQTDVEGLGLLDVETVFTGDKRTFQVDGELTGAALGPAGTALRGYEIHMGRSIRGKGVRPLVRLLSAGSTARAGDAATVEAAADDALAGQDAWHDDGAVSADGVVCGSYVHGIFDHLGLRTAFLNGLRATAGPAPSPGPDRGSDPSPKPDRGSEASPPPSEPSLSSDASPEVDGARIGSDIDRLADHVEAHLDMAVLDRIIGLG
jgi:adenosylcobyric acid synthase